ncbi:hypothetical protein K432DRAFT_144826 [Lepidopterella palustris CBS 459.81]|uniref:Uncharacterized protein n=1 Tax=Lepidopterella palustris CBS 459.81 TaxID=1314670 RepID=A0A8E2JIY1_9PEZI|nr:hypothetical protein K432DRAFT_144826 [Lepidopterella palustris CBS 459.81]
MTSVIRVHRWNILHNRLLLPFAAARTLMALPLVFGRRTCPTYNAYISRIISGRAPEGRGKSSLKATRHCNWHEFFARCLQTPMHGGRHARDL